MRKKFFLFSLALPAALFLHSAAQADNQSTATLSTSTRQLVELDGKTKNLSPDQQQQQLETLKQQILTEIIKLFQEADPAEFSHLRYEINHSFPQGQEGRLLNYQTKDIGHFIYELREWIHSPHFSIKGLIIHLRQLAGQPEITDETVHQLSVQARENIDRAATALIEAVQSNPSAPLESLSEAQSFVQAVVKAFEDGVYRPSIKGWIITIITHQPLLAFQPGLAPLFNQMTNAFSRPTADETSFALSRFLSPAPGASPPEQLAAPPDKRFFNSLTGDEKADILLTFVRRAAETLATTMSEENTAQEDTAKDMDTLRTWLLAARHYCPDVELATSLEQIAKEQSEHPNAKFGQLLRELSRLLSDPTPNLLRDIDRTLLPSVPPEQPQSLGAAVARDVYRERPSGDLVRRSLRPPRGGTVDWATPRRAERAETPKAPPPLESPAARLAKLAEALRKKLDREAWISPQPRDSESLAKLQEILARAKELAERAERPPAGRAK